mgnify:CR=1 FL=1
MEVLKKRLPLIQANKRENIRMKLMTVVRKLQNLILSLLEMINRA